MEGRRSILQGGREHSSPCTKSLKGGKCVIFFLELPLASSPNAPHFVVLQPVELLLVSSPPSTQPPAYHDILLPALMW